jgi:D-glycero-D-manno-heptose 1,7-bisphosphate phosphatase
VRPAVFLDRDGTLIELVHHLTDPADVRLIPGAAPAVARLRRAGFAAVVVTNQSVIGRGLLDEAGLAEVHAEMHRQLAAKGTAVDSVYFCPTAPATKDPTVIEDPMRKPGPGMLMAAAQDHALDLAASWMVGDTVSDMLHRPHDGRPFRRGWPHPWRETSMKILITGGAGYVGSACLRHVASQGHEVVAYDNLKEGHSRAVGGCDLVVGDIADTDRLAQTLRDFGAEAVMHFAAATNVGESVTNPNTTTATTSAAR